MIIDKEKLIFIHIPKNAGESIKKLLIGEKDFNGLKRPWKHKTITNIKENNPKAYNDYKKFAIVRNPYNRMVSMYAYLKKYKLSNDLLNTYQYNSKTNSYEIVDTVKAPIDGFRQWWKDKNADPQKVHGDLEIAKRLFNSQSDWIDDTVRIIKYENLNEELSVFFNKDIELPVVNSTSTFEYSKYYDQDTANIIYDRYKKDFEKFNYKKI
jgi:hypothetical protein